MRTNVYFCILITNPNFNTMKKFILFAALLLATIAATAQRDYDSGHKYGLFSNLDVGISGQYAHNFADKKGNWGADLRMTKRIGDHWRLRGLVDVNGFVNNGFDRYAKGLVGISFDALPFYTFFDYGFNWNRSSQSQFGLAGDAGIGFNFNIGRGLSLYTEVGADRINNGEDWQSNGFVKVGYSASLGITEADRVAIDIDRHVHSEYGELKGENQILKSEAKKAAETNEQLQATLERATALCESLEKRLNDCTETTRQAVTANPLPPIYFEYASAYLTPIEEEKVAMIAEAINADNPVNVYMLEGYCSANGDPYRNQKLSEERAQTVFFALVQNGVESTRLVIVGNGMTDKDAPLDQKVIVRKAIQ